MSIRIPLATLTICLIWCGASSARAASFPSYHPGYPPPPGYESPFQLSQDYPDVPPEVEDYPWLGIDFENEPFLYLESVLAYGLEGNIEVDWEIAKNPVRTWYHAPWMQTGCSGREFARGMTRERTSRKCELHPNQKDWTDNWAVGMYNPPGGYVLGQVWGDPQSPDPSAADFPVGTVGIKLLFTTGTAEEVPYLENSLSWQGNVYDMEGNPCIKSVADRPRVMRDLLLFQLDIAVRDDRSTDTGWVFGTFVYDAAAEGESPFERLVPVGVSWGNDPTIEDDLNRVGAFVNTALAQNVVNSELVRPELDPADTCTLPDDGWPANRAFVTHFGLGGRVNGPIDNPASSCMSCHGMAGAPSQRPVPSGADPATYTKKNFEKFFANIPPGPEVTPTFTRLDYSLQLAFGNSAFARCSNDPSLEGCPAAADLVADMELLEAPLEPGADISRAGPALEDEQQEAPSEPAPSVEPEAPGAGGGISLRIWILGGLILLALLYLIFRKR